MVCPTYVLQDVPSVTNYNSDLDPQIDRGTVFNTFLVEIYFSVYGVLHIGFQGS